MFKNAKFGDKYRTKSGEIAIFQCSVDDYNFLFTKSCSYSVDNSGIFEENNSDLNIIEKIKPNIEKLAQEWENRHRPVIDSEWCSAYIQEAYKEGYRLGSEI